MQKKFFYREAIRDLLRGIASLDSWPGPTELMCGWFDDNYWPADLERDRQSKEFLEWQSCFSEVQLNALERFHSHFSKIVDKLSDDPIRFGDDPEWGKLSTLASQILPLFEGEE